MKILYLLRYYPTLTETFVYQEIETLRRTFSAQITIASLGSREDGQIQNQLPNAGSLIGYAAGCRRNRPVRQKMGPFDEKPRRLEASRRPRRDCVPRTSLR